MNDWAEHDVQTDPIEDLRSDLEDAKIELAANVQGVSDQLDELERKIDNYDYFRAHQISDLDNRLPSALPSAGIIGQIALIYLQYVQIIHWEWYFVLAPSIITGLLVLFALTFAIWQRFENSDWNSFPVWVTIACVVVFTGFIYYKNLQSSGHFDPPKIKELKENSKRND